MAVVWRSAYNPTAGSSRLSVASSSITTPTTTALRLIRLSASRNQLACEFLRGRMRFNPKVLDDPEYEVLDREISALCEDVD